MISPHDIQALLTQPLPFGEATVLEQLEVHDVLLFEGREISSFDFSRSVFHAPVRFRNCHFTGLSWFKQCRFLAGVDFSQSCFSNDARFDSACFEQAFGFHAASVDGASDFSSCRFKASVDFSEAVFSGNLSFEATLFESDVSLHHVECLGGFWAEQTVFQGLCDTRGMDVHGRVWLKAMSSQRHGQRHALQNINAYGYEWLL